MSGFEADAQQMETAASQIEEVRSNVDHAVKTLHGQIEPVMAGCEGQPAIVFRRLMERFQQNADTINRKLGEIGEAVQISGKEYDKNEQEQADQMSRIEGLLEG